MPIVGNTKADLADELGVTRGRVSQFIKSGMPACADGTLDRHAALNWVARTNLGPTGDKARELLRGEGVSTRSKKKGEPAWLKGAPPIPPGFTALRKIENPASAMAVAALLEVLGQVGARASMSAYGAGASREIAERTGEVMTMMFVTLIEEYVAGHRIIDPKELTFPHPKNFDEVNWPELGPPGEFARQGN